MSVRSIIRQFLAGVMLILLVFSITPKQALHDWLANHKDAATACFYGDVTHFGHDGFHCHCENLVAESPFTHQAARFDFSVAPVFASRQIFATRRFYAVTHFFFSLRGPPANTLL